MLALKANKENNKSWLNVGLTHAKDLTEPMSINKAATMLAAKFSENLGKGCVLRDDSVKVDWLFLMTKHVGYLLKS